MSHKILIENAVKRQKAFKNLEKNLQNIKKTVKKLDPNAEIYLFGSVAEKNYNYSSDVDVLILTTVKPAIVHAELWKSGIKEPFEIHVHSPEKASFYKTKVKLVKVS
ncbi:MAG: nucleotidyltransferase domain-containing protein [Candidatus Bathyarchaeia archaeon]